MKDRSVDSDIKSVLTSHIIDHLERVRETVKQQWDNSPIKGVRYFYVDDLLPADLAKQVADAFPKNDNLWFQRDSFRERKKTFAKIDTINPLMPAITDAIQDEKVVKMVSDITGMDNLEGDYNLYAGGLSMMGPGDFLNPHIDNSHDGARSRYRRLNLLYYISPDWDVQNGGNLELWDDGVSQPHEIHAKFNRLVVMETNKCSWHSVNKVRVDGHRCCVSNYYFSKGSPTGEEYYHVTSFMGRPEQSVVRAYSKVDNFLRQTVSEISKTSRGKAQGRLG